MYRTADFTQVVTQAHFNLIFNLISKVNTFVQAQHISSTFPSASERVLIMEMHRDINEVLVLIHAKQKKRDSTLHDSLGTTENKQQQRRTKTKAQRKYRT